MPMPMSMSMSVRMAMVSMVRMVRPAVRLHRTRRAGAVPARRRTHRETGVGMRVRVLCVVPVRLCVGVVRVVLCVVRVVWVEDGGR